MKRSEKALCVLFAVLAAGGLVTTVSQTIAFLRTPDNGGLPGLLDQMYATPASAAASNELTFLTLAAVVFMIVEARRLNMRHLWAYIVAGCLVAISMAFALFLLARQVKLAHRASVKGSSPD